VLARPGGALGRSCAVEWPGRACGVRPSWASIAIAAGPVVVAGRGPSEMAAANGWAIGEPELGWLAEMPLTIFPNFLKVFLFISTISYLLHGFLYVYTYVPCMYTPLGVVH
jgi:hypothetical protein